MFVSGDACLRVETKEGETLVPGGEGTWGFLMHPFWASVLPAAKHLHRIFREKGPGAGETREKK